MNPPTIVEPDTPNRVRQRIGVGAAAVVLGLATAIGLTLLVGQSAGPSTVPSITFENPTAYALDIEVSPGSGRAWTSAGSVRQKSTTEVHEVIDQGDVWLFRFDSQGETGGELQLTRAELEASGWTVAIPVEGGTRLADAGAPPTP
jgi:hypothetical protein